MKNFKIYITFVLLALSAATSWSSPKCQNVFALKLELESHIISRIEMLEKLLANDGQLVREAEHFVEHRRVKDQHHPSTIEMYKSLQEVLKIEPVPAEVLSQNLQSAVIQIAQLSSLMKQDGFYDKDLIARLEKLRFKTKFLIPPPYFRDAPLFPGTQKMEAELEQSYMDLMNLKAQFEGYELQELNIR